MNIDNLFKTENLLELKQELNSLINNNIHINEIVEALVKKAIPITHSSDIFDNKYNDFTDQIFFSQTEDLDVITIRAELSTKWENTFARIGSDYSIIFKTPITVAKTYSYSDKKNGTYIEPLENYKDPIEVLNECVHTAKQQLTEEYFIIIDHILNYS